MIKQTIAGLDFGASIFVLVVDWVGTRRCAPDLMVWSRPIAIAIIVSPSFASLLVLAQWSRSPLPCPAPLDWFLPQLRRLAVGGQSNSHVGAVGCCSVACRRRRCRIDRPSNEAWFDVRFGDLVSAGWRHRRGESFRRSV